MTTLLVACLFFVSLAAAAVFIAGAVLFCVGAHLCWQQIQVLRRVHVEPLLEDAHALGAYKQNGQVVEKPDDGLPTDEEVEEWLMNSPKR